MRIFRRKREPIDLSYVFTDEGMGDTYQFGHDQYRIWTWHQDFITDGATEITLTFRRTDKRGQRLTPVSFYDSLDRNVAKENFTPQELPGP